MKKFIFVFLSLILIGCKSTNISESKVSNLSTNSTVKVVSAYNPWTRVYEWDHWDFYINAIKKGSIIFEWPTAIFVYLISNVKVFDSRPEETNLDWSDHIVVTIIVLRWSW